MLDQAWRLRLDAAEAKGAEECEAVKRDYQAEIQGLQWAANTERSLLEKYGLSTAPPLQTSSCSQPCARRDDVSAQDFSQLQSNFSSFMCKCVCKADDVSQPDPG